MESYNAVYNIAVDKSNNVYCVGHSNGAFQFYEESLGVEPFNGRLQEYYITKFNERGEYQWMRSGGGEKYETAGSVAIDGDNNIIVGCFSESGEMYVEGDTLTNTAYSNGFIIKYSSSGQKLWVKQIGTGTTEFWPQVQIDEKNNIYVLTRQNNTSIIHKLNPMGVSTWSTLIPGAYVSAIQYANQNLYVVAGSFVDSLYYAQDLIANSKSVVILRLDSQGDLVSYAAFPGMIWPTRILIDNSSSIFLSGSYLGNLTVGSATVAHSNGFDIYVVKLDSSYQLMWGKGFQKDGNNMIMGSAILQNGDIMIAGSINSIPCSGYGPCCYGVISRPEGNFYLAQLSGNDGSLKWERKCKEKMSGCGSYASCVTTVPNSNNVIVGGYSTYGQISTDEFVFTKGACFIAGTSSTPVYIEEQSINESDLFPNPCQNVISIKTFRPSEIQVFSVLGELMIEDKAKQNIRSLDVSGFPNGIYVVRISVDGETLQRKIVVGH